MTIIAFSIATGLLICGLVILGWGANFLISGAASLAKRMGMSPLVIGLTIIALGTSLPEIVISFIAVAQGNPGLAVGNAIGSNIANIGLVLGITAIVTPLQMRSRTLRSELPLLFLVMLLVGVLMLDGVLSRIDAIILMIVALFVVVWLVYQGIHQERKKTRLEGEYKQEIPRKINIFVALFQLLIGLILLPFGSKVVVESASYMARFFQVSDLVIGLTIVALGTSLPELATSIIGARRKEFDIVLGNIIGSNIFNLLAVLAIPALLYPFPFSTLVLLRDFAVMFALTILLYLFSFGLRGPEKTTRYEGVFLVLVYVAYLISIFFFLK